MASVKWRQLELQLAVAVTNPHSIHNALTIWQTAGHVLYIHVAVEVVSRHVETKEAKAREILYESKSDGVFNRPEVVPEVVPHLRPCLVLYKESSYIISTLHVHPVRLMPIRVSEQHHDHFLVCLDVEFLLVRLSSPNRLPLNDKVRERAEPLTVMRPYALRHVLLARCALFAVF